MSVILFFSLYKFYKGLKRIGLKFSNKSCNLAMHIAAFGLPIIAGFVYIIFIFRFNQLALFLNRKAGTEQWNILGPKIFYDISNGTTQLLQLILVTNYSVRASGRKIVTSKQGNENRSSGGATKQFNDHIEYLMNRYKES